MSVWRSFLASVLPWLFRSAETAATQAVNKQKVTPPAPPTDAESKAIEDAAQAAADKTLKSLKGK